MDSINELELRKLLKEKLPAQETLTVILRRVLDPKLDWEERRGYWYYLFLTQRKATIASALKQAILAKTKAPLELVIQLGDEAGEQPRPVVIQAMIKGLKKLELLDSIFAAKAWDKWDRQLVEMRAELVEKKVVAQREFKENLVEKFWFLRNQRMSEQAGRVLRRLIELFPDDGEFAKLKSDFDEQWARDVLANHAADTHESRIDRTRTAPSGKDEEMLRSFLEAASGLIVEKRGIALDLAIAFYFLEDYNRALETLAWAEPSATNDWLRAELLLESRRFLEGLEHLNRLEVKYINDPEATFAVTYLRAQYLHGLGQHGSALEILQSIVRVRPNYRSAHALILEWTEGVSWE